MNLLIKPVSGACNMRCSYCFYADEMAHRNCGILGVMDDGTIDTVITKAMERSKRGCNLLFQGGEPTLVGLDFYKHLVNTASKYGKGKISYSLQTNGYKLDSEWASFFAEKDFLIGLSIDGPRKIHDLYRRGADGKGSFDSVMNTLRLFEKYRVKYNVLSVVTAQTARHASSVCNFFSSRGFKFQQFIPCLDGLDCESSTPYALSDSQYALFLRRTFDAWYADILVGRYVFNRTFENWMLIMLGRAPECCSMVGECSMQYVIEADGSVYPCDFYVLDEYKLGNIMTDSFDDIDLRRQQLGFIERSRELSEECLKCRWYKLCRGGCYRERVGSGIPKSRFCKAYLEFFPYAADRLANAARLITSPGYPFKQ